MSALADLQALDVLERMAGQDSVLHRRDARAKILATGCFIAALVSLPPFDLEALPPFALLWLLAATLGGLPLKRLVRPAFAALPFALLLGSFNPILDRRPWSLGPWTLSAGWISLAVIAGKAWLAAAAATLLAACTDFADLCNGLARLGVPRLFTQQLLFLWRYLGVLTDEGQRLLRARDLRCAPGSPGRGVATAARLIGSLLARALDRAQRIHSAMLCRLWDGGALRRRSAPWVWGDGAFLGAALATVAACRFLPITAVLGAWLNRGNP